MGLFSEKARQLPTTSYGYTPPAEATASGWQCNNVDCGTGDSPAPKRWPARCPLCGGSVDPEFNRPWKEEARGYRLQMLMDREGDKYGVLEASIREWKYGQALAQSDFDRAEALRTETHTWLGKMSEQIPHFAEEAETRSMIVRHALAYGQTDAAADELSDWLAGVDVFHLDTTHLGDNTDEGRQLRRTCFSLLPSALDFLATPSARSHRSAPLIDQAARHLGSITQHELPPDMVRKWQTLMAAPQRS